MGGKIREEKGYTLIEMMLVLALLAILLAGSALGAVKQLKRGRDAKRKADLEELGLVLNDYYDARMEYPDELPECGSEWKLGETVILEEVPCSPGEEGYRYIYDDQGSQDWFKLYTNLEYEEDKVIDELNCRQGCGPDCLYNYGIASSNVRIDSCGEKEELKYVCAPGGGCEVFEDPQASQCPRVYINNPSCENECEERENRCRDSRGKLIPEE